MKVLNGLFAVAAGAMLIAVGFRISQLRGETRSAYEQRTDLADRLSMATLEREAAIVLAGVTEISGRRINAADQDVLWTPRPVGHSLIVFVAPVCTVSRSLVQSMDELALDSTHVMVASMSGDGHAVEGWVPDGVAVDMLTNPMINGRRLPVMAAPMTAVWQDGRLIEVLVGKSRAMEWFTAHGLTRARGDTSHAVLQ